MEELVVVFRAAGLSEAEIIKGFLESEDIPVHLSYESAGPVYGLTMDGLGEVRVKVPAGFASLAREMLDERLRGDPEPDGTGRWHLPHPDADDPEVA
jgi:hypothetical protein